MPNAFNEVIGLVKGTSVVFIVALPELFYTVQVIYNRNQRVIPMLLVAVVWYAIITTVLSIAQYYVERRFARGAVRASPADALCSGPAVGRPNSGDDWATRRQRMPRRERRPPPHRRPSGHPQFIAPEVPHELQRLAPSFDEQYVLARRASNVGRVEIADVTKSYGTHPVLRDVSLTIEPGEVVVLIGPSGSGKSTLLRTINHLETVDRGSITVDGEYIG